MNAPSGAEIFESFLNLIESEAAENPPAIKPTSEELLEKYDDFLTEKLHPQFDGDYLDEVRERAEKAYDEKKVVEALGFP